MSGDVVIVEFMVPAIQAVRLQSLLQGEDGLATIRCLDPEKKRQQFWTTPEQRNELQAWIESLPDSINLEITGEWLWRDDGQGAE